MLDRGSVRHRGPTTSGNYLSEVRLQSLSGATVMDQPEEIPTDAQPATADGVDPEPTRVDVAVAFLKRFFTPATDAGQCSIMLTTDQLFDRINSHSPGETSKHDLVAALRKAGYLEQYIGAEFKWLLNLATAA